MYKLGVNYSRFEPAVFLFFFFLHFKNEIEGLLITHLDYFCRGGTEKFLKIVIEPLQIVFSVKSENVKIFEYLGLDIIQNSKYVKIFEYLGLDIIQNSKYDFSLNQTKFVDEIKEIVVRGDRSKQKYRPKW